MIGTRRLGSLVLGLAACGPGDLGGLEVEDAGAVRDAARAADAAPAPDAGRLVAVPDPGAPPYPSTIGVLSLAVRTGSGANDGTDDNDLSLCLTATRCFPLNLPDVDDFRVGELDGYAFEDVGLARASVDRVELRSANGVDAWRPACLELRFDGEPVYCETTLPGFFGNAPGELRSWRDPRGLHATCETCYPGKLTHGPMLGAVEADRARVWLRADARRRVALRLAESAGGPWVPVAWAYPEARRDFTAVLEARGLAPGRRYLYQVEVDGVAQLPEPLPVSTSPPAGTPGKLELAFGSCTRAAEQPIFATIAADPPQAFLFLGDNHYANTSDLGALRWNYRWALERPERAALLARTPTLAVWDDHDFTGNNTTGASPGKATARRVFTEYWAHRGAGSPTGEGIYHRWERGDVAFFFLDDRTWRALDGMLGAEQTAWLLDGLERSDATFKLLVSGSQWTLQGSPDSWAAFPGPREALFDAIRDRGIEGVVLLSGDVHRAETRLIRRGADLGYDLPELTSSPLANSNFPCGGDGELRSCFDDGDFYMRLSIDTTLPDPLLRATIHDADGVELDRWDIRRSMLEP